MVELLKVDDKGSGKDFVNGGADETDNKRVICNFVHISAAPNSILINFAMALVGREWWYWLATVAGATRRILHSQTEE